MMKRLLVIGCVLSFVSSVFGQHRFTDVDKVLAHISKSSLTLQSNSIKLDQAKKAKLIAILGVPDPSGETYFNYTHNNKLPVNLFPAEIFGGASGTYTQVQMGVPYVSNFVNNAEVRLINVPGWQNLKLSKLNIESTDLENKISLKSLQEDISTTYYNIVSLQEQLSNTRQNVGTAKELLDITQNKYDEGLIKQQDLNDAKINYINTQENERQISFQIDRQYLALKILCDIPDEEEVIIEHTGSLDQSVGMPVVELNNITVENSLLEEKKALLNFRQQKSSLIPTLSFFHSSTSQQNNTRGKLFDNNVDWIKSSYLGLKLSLPLPSANSISQQSKAKYDYKIAQKNTEQQKIKSQLEYKQLGVDYEKAVSQAKTYKNVYLLRNENYEKNLNLYKEGLTALDKVLDSFNNMVESHYSLVSAQITVLSAETKIAINNKIK